MKKSALFLGFFLLLSPGFALAASPTCSAQGYTVVFVNGIFDTEPQAQADANALSFQLGSQLNSEPVTVQLGYNPTHLAGLGDVAQSASQLFNKPISNFDLNTVLLEMYPEVTTRKLLLVGHSQGSFYTNDMYHYLLSHGEPGDSVAVYNVASPAAYTAGHGTYLTSSGDSFINTLRAFHFDILPNNVDLTPTDPDGVFPGHSFVDNYLAQAAPQILGGMSSEMRALKPTDATDHGDCFTPPVQTLGYQTEAAAFAVADPTAIVFKAGAVTVTNASAVALKAAATLATGALQFFADTITVTTSPPTDAKAVEKTNTIIDKLYGSSLDNLSPQDKKELLGGSQGSAVILSQSQDKPVAVNGGLVDGTSTAPDTDFPTPATSSAPASIFPQSSNGPVWTSGGGGGKNTPPAESAQALAADVVAPEVIDDVASTTEEATTTDVATSTPDVASTTPPVVLPPTGAPFTDTFDAYDRVAWSTPESPYHTLILFDKELDETNCRTNGCVVANGGLGGIGTGSQSGFMFKKSGVGQLEGHFSIWGKSNHGQGGLGFCAVSSVDCQSDSKRYENFFPDDNAWHHYYVAWRQGAAVVDGCVLIDDITAPCIWNPTQFPLGTEFDGILLMGFSPRPDLGTHVWFDDLEDGPAPN